RAVGQPEDDVNVKAGLTVVSDRHVSDRAQYLTLLSDLNLFVSLLFKIEPSDRRLFESADGCQRGCPKLGVVREFRQRGDRLFSGVQNGDTGLKARVASYLGALHGRQAALRWSCRPSLISSMIFALKASRSPGFRDVMMPWSTTTSVSSHFAPALATSAF